MSEQPPDAYREHRVRIGVPLDSLPVRLVIELFAEQARPVWEPMRVVNIRTEPGGQVVGQLQTGEQVTELAQAERPAGVVWIQHARGWTAASVLRRVTEQPGF